MTQSFADPGTPMGGGSSTRTATVNLNANVSGYTQGMGDAAQSTGALASGLDQIQARLTSMNRWAGKKLFHFAAADFAVLAGATTDAALFEKQLSTLNSTAAVTGTSMSGIRNGIETAFTKFPVARGQVIDLTEAITNLGVTSVRDIGSLTQTFIKLGAATGEPMSQLAGGLIQLSRLMGNTGATQIGNYANALLTVSKNAGVSASGVLSFAQAIAPIARQAGISEGAVLGFSTAFTKAGADGLIAANTFNSMVSSISEATATGSPDLAKYANLIGVSVEKFKTMDKTNAMVDILQAIAKEGPQSLAILSSLGVASTRAQAAIAAVTQTGDLRDQVASTINAQGDQHNLNKGSQAAMGGLADSLVNVRNEFTQFGTEIGSTFLRPLTLMSNLVVRVTQDLNALYKPFAPIIAGLATVAGAASGIGSIALTASGAIGAYALLRNVQNSFRRGTMSAFREGLNPNAPNAMRPGGAMDRYTSGQMGFFQRRLYETGTGFRGLMGRAGIAEPGAERSPWRSLSTWRNLGIAAPMMGWRGASRMNEQFLRAAMAGDPRPTESTSRATGRRVWAVGMDAARAEAAGAPAAAAAAGTFRERWRTLGLHLAGRSSLDIAAEQARATAMQAGATARATGGLGMQLGGRLLNAGWRLAGPTIMGAIVGGATGLPGGRRLANAGINSLPTGDLRSEARNVGVAFNKLGGATKELWSGTSRLKTAWGELGTAGGKAATSLLRLSGTAAGWGIGKTVSGIGTGIGAAVKGIGAVGGIAARAAFSLPGMVGIMGMTKLAAMDDARQHAGDVDKFTNPIQKYNDMLGTTTSNLASFNAKLIEGAGSVPSAVGSYKEAAHVAAGDQSNAPNKAKNSVFGDVLAQHGNDKSPFYAKSLGSVPQGLADALAAMPISDPKQLQAAKEDMFAGGATQQQVVDAMKIYMAHGGPNQVSGVNGNNDTWRNLGLAAAATEGGQTHVGGQFNLNPNMSKSVRGGHILGTMVSGIDSQRISDEQTVGGVYAQQKALQSYATGLAPMVANISMGSKSQSTTSGKALADVMSKITGGSSKKYLEYLMAHHGDGGDTAEQQQQFFVKALGQTSQGKKWEAALGDKGTLNVAAMNEKLVDLSNAADGSSFNGLLRRSGGMGRFAAGDKTVQSAIGSQQSNVGVVNESIERLLAHAEKMGGGLAGAANELSKFQGAVGDNTSVLYKQITAAQALAVQEQSYRQPFQTRQQNFTQTVRSYQGAARAYYDTPVSKRTDEQHTFMQSRREAYQQALAGEQTYMQSMYQTAQSYGTQMTRAEEDNQTQIKRSTDAFHLQMSNAQHDFLQSRNRAEADHDTQLRNQIATSAQGIYNPFLRVQAQYTADAGTTVQNLKDQNERIRQQQANLNKLHKEGLSTSTIQTLDLANPNNAQQTQALMDATPEQIRQMNREADKRKKATKGLVENPFNLSFAQSEADFKKQLDRSQADYDRSVQLANTAQGLAMKYMADDYGKTVKRAGEDLTTAMTEVTGNFGSMYDKTMAQIAKSVQKFSPKAAAQMRKDIGGLVTQFPWLASGDATKYKAGGSPAAPKQPGDPGFVGPVNATKHPDVPKHAAGGIATSAQMGIIGEAGPEAMIPLNQRGQDFMAGLIAKAMGQVLHITNSQAPVQQSSTTDSSTNFTGPVTVVSQDTAAFAREMKAKARLARLMSPAHR